MSIIKLSEPWCFNAMSLEQSEVRELQKYFVNEDSHQCDWSNTDYCGITSDGLSEYFSSPEFFDEDDDNNKTTVYTIKQLRNIIAEHLAKQPVEKLEDGVVYSVKDTHCPEESWLAVNKVAYVNIHQEYLDTAENGDDVDWQEQLEEGDRWEFTKATPEQVAHYEACVKAGKYVEPESVKFDYVKCVEIVPRGSDDHSFTVGKVYPHPNTVDDKDILWRVLPLNGAKYKFEPSTEAEYFAQNQATQFVVGKWYKWFQKDHGREQKGKCATLYDSHFEMKPWICHSSEYVESGMFNLRDAESIEVIENLSEIQDLLPDGHEDKWVKTAPKSERYLATMRFFEQLREPERSEAIANYDEDYDEQVPETLAEALEYGFNWENSPQGNDYWEEEIHHPIDYGSYFEKEELLVFGKYKVGDIVVSLEELPRVFKEGYMLKIEPTSTKECIRFIPKVGEDNRCLYSSHKLRPATSEEVEAYNQGIRNVADIKPKDYKEAVHCSTQEEWDFVLSKFNNDDVWPKSSNMITSSSWSQHKKDSYINTERGSFGDVNGTGKDWGYTILTFKQWCEKYGHSYEIVPEYVECVNSTSNHYKEGKIYTWLKTITEEGEPNKPGILKGSVWEFKPSTKEAYDKQQEKLKMEDLLNEAKRRYPAGTKFKCLVSNNIVHEVEDLSLFKIHFDTIFYKNQVVYDGTKWAEIVKEEPKPTEIKPAKGMHVRCLKENSWSDGKTKVGQVFVIEDVHWNGDMWVNNHLFAKERLGRGDFELLPNYKEEPWVAQVGDWVYVLENCAYGSVLNKGEIVKCIKYDTISQQFKEEGCTWLSPKDYRKATQEEIDSVTKQNVETSATNFKVGDKVIVQTWHYANVAKHLPCKGVIVNVKPDSTAPFEIELEKVIYGSGKAWWFRKGEFVLDASTEPEWTADNWYVEVNSQEEANAVIDAAAKMYDKPYDKSFVFEEQWKYVGLCKKNKDFTILRIGLTHDGAKPRPITDFIQKSGIIAEDFHKSWVEKQVDAIIAGEYVQEMQEASLQGVSNLEKATTHQKTVSSIWEQVHSVFDKHNAKQDAKQDELVIYKPKQTRLVEPGAVSASASTTNLIIKSNSKYL